MSHNITVEGGTSVRLPTAGKYCDRDIVITATGGDSDVLKYIEAQHATVDLPNATSIKPFAFAIDRVIIDISMPKVTSIGGSAFYQCSKLTITSLPEGLTSIGDNAFYECSKLTITSLPKGLTSIGDNAFYKCTKLTTITFKGKPQTIASRAFQKCTYLTTINVPWAEGEVAYAPWGATKATINYNYTGE